MTRPEPSTAAVAVVAIASGDTTRAPTETAAAALTIDRQEGLDNVTPKAVPDGRGQESDPIRPAQPRVMLSEPGQRVWCHGETSGDVRVAGSVDQDTGPSQCANPQSSTAGQRQQES